ncbi:MAG: SH3 domain-containing protein [Cyanobacteria bacterium J06559_3]
MVFAGVGCQQSSENTATPDSPDAAAESAIAETAPQPEAAQSATQTNETTTAPATSDASSTEVSVDSAIDASADDDTNRVAANSEQQCAAAAYVADTDPAGLNVRSGPGSEFEVIDTLPTDGPVEVEITSSANGWLQLDIAWSMAQQELETPGWVYAPLLGVTTHNNDASQPSDAAPLFSTPDTASEVIAEIPQFTEVSLLGCSGPWLEVQTGETTGWLADENQCHSPVTTCP